MDNSWIKSYRSILDWEWHDVPAMMTIWVHLLHLARNNDLEWHGMMIRRGQLATTLSKLSLMTGLTVKQVRTCLKRLKASHQIDTERANNMTIITICKFEVYQPQEDEQGQTNGIQRAPEGQQVKNERMKEYIYNSLSQDAHARTREEELAERMIAEQQWFEQLCMSRRISQQDMAAYIMDFCNYLRDIGKEETLYDAKIHFVNQLPKQIKLLKEYGQQNNYCDPVARRNYERYQRLQATAARFAALGADDQDAENKIF